MTMKLGSAALVELSDDELVARFQGGDNDSLDVLLQRYRRFTRAKARGYFLIGADSDDIEQEGMIGLFKAVRDFRPDRQASFRAFAELCITRQIITAIKTATRQKHQPLNSYLSLSGTRPGEENGSGTVEEVLEAKGLIDPIEFIISMEDLRSMRLQARGRGPAPLRRGQVLPGDRRGARPARQVHRQRPPAHQAQARRPPRRAGRRRGRRLAPLSPPGLSPSRRAPSRAPGGGALACGPPARVAQMVRAGAL
jgi:RNA polymerase sigma-H factor